MPFLAKSILLNQSNNTSGMGIYNKKTCDSIYNTVLPRLTCYPNQNQLRPMKNGESNRRSPLPFYIFLDTLTFLVLFHLETPNPLDVLLILLLLQDAWE